MGKPRRNAANYAAQTASTSRTFERRFLIMLDLIFIAAIIGFFLLTLAYIKGGEKLKGSNNES